MNMIRDINTKKLVKTLSILAIITTISGCSHSKKTQQYFHHNNNNYSQDNPNTNDNKNTPNKNTPNKNTLSVFAAPNKSSKNISKNTNKIHNKINQELKISHQDHIKLKQVEADAHKEDPTAQWKLGMIYFKGLAGVQEDNDIAFNWIKKSSEQKYPPAEYMLGFFYEHGIGVTKNDSTANRYYKLAKQHGFKIED